MGTREHTAHAPVVAAFAPQSAAREPVEFGLAASRLTGAPLVIAVVAETGLARARFGADLTDALPDAVREPVRHLELELKRRKVDAEIRFFADSTPARGLARAIDEHDPELIVLGSTHRGSKGSVLLGTTAERVIHASACPVAVVPNGYTRPEEGVAVVGVAYTGTPEGEDALHAAARLAAAGGARLRLITVLDPDHAERQVQELMADQSSEGDPATRARSAVESRARELAGIDAEVDIRVDDPAPGLIDASGHVDLLVMGSRGMGPRRAVLLGSVSRRVIDAAACPVIVIPRGTSERSEALVGDVEAHAPRVP